MKILTYIPLVVCLAFFNFFDAERDYACFEGSCRVDKDCAFFSGHTAQCTYGCCNYSPSPWKGSGQHEVPE
nr:hypothetical protein BgiMline_004552 [Biomphalaria glabrata]